MKLLTCLLALACALSACANRPEKPENSSTPSARAAGAEPYPSTYRVPQRPPVLIRSTTVLTGTGARIDAADVLIVDGRISAVGSGLAAPEGAQLCSKCSTAAVVMMDGCMTCLSCGDSKCG